MLGNKLKTLSLHIFNSIILAFDLNACEAKQGKFLIFAIYCVISETKYGSKSNIFKNVL